ncbi:MAG: hypothetical protein HZA79_10480 [Sphingobacteriales bacterium]|nr:hypothetical protein [Sphingobacteriales bacterium]
MVKSRFNFIFYFLVSVYSSFLIGSLLLLLGTGSFNSIKEPATPQIVGFILVLVIIFWGGSTFIKKAFITKTGSGQIILQGLFKKRSISASDITEINPYAKENFYNITGEVTIVTNITLVTGEKIIIPEILYKNSKVVREAIQHEFEDKLPTADKYYKSPYLPGLPKQKFAGNPWFSFNTILLIGLAAFFLYNVSNSISGKNGWIFLPIFIVFYIGFGFQMFYFVIKDSALTVRNHYFPWYKKACPLEDISIVSFETPYRKSESLRIFRHDQSSNIYGAGSLRTKDWNQLKAEFTKLGIRIR